MNTPTAVATLQSLITQKQTELDSLTLALDILNQTFKSDIDAITAAQADADTERAKVQTLTDALSQANQAVLADPAVQAEIGVKEVAV